MVVSIVLSWVLRQKMERWANKANQNRQVLYCAYNTTTKEVCTMQELEPMSLFITLSS